MKKKKQNNIWDFNPKDLEFDLCKDEYNLEAEIEPGYRLYVPWLHREFWTELNQEPNQENEARTKKQGRSTEKLKLK